MPLLLALALAAQVPTTLAEYLQAHPPQGAWVAVDAEHVTAGAPTGLDSFDRKAVKVGGLTAIVPRTMVQLADFTQGAPDPRAGIAAGYELNALLASLDETQWRRLGGDGLSPGDLQESQRQLFAAAFPQPLHYTVYSAQGTSHREISSSDFPRVKLRMQRRIKLEISTGGGRGYYLQETDYLNNPSGQPSATIDRSGEGDSLYGVPIRKTVPNAVKTGGLKFDRFTGLVPTGPRTVRETLAACGRGTELLADRRVAELSVVRSGATSAEDLLRALALAVTGVYRPVGSAYVLTSDLVGQGARALALGAWQDLAFPQLNAQLRDWRKQMREAGALRAIGYDKNDPLASDESFADEIEEWGSTARAKPVAVSQMPKAYRDLIARLRSERANLRGLQDSDYDHVGVVFAPSMTLELPDRTQVSLAEVSFAEPSMPPPLAIAQTSQTADAAPLPLGPDVTLIADASTVSEGEAIVRLAKGYGFRAVWMETDSDEALKAGLAMGVAVRLAVRPWTAPVGARPVDPDRNVLGERAPVAVERAAHLETSLPTRVFPLSPLGRDLLSPDAERDTARWPVVARLAHVAGLQGVALLDEQPPGYAGDRSRWYGREAFTRLGYSDSARLTFLRSHGFDPIDLPVNPSSSLPANLVAPFFPDVRFGRAIDRRRSNPATLESAPRAWSEQCASANQAGLEALRNALTGVDLIEAKSASISILRPSGTMDAAAEGRFRAGLAARYARSQMGSFVIDLSDVPPARRAAVLGRLILRRNPSP